MTTGNLTIQDNETAVQYTSVGESSFVFPFPILAASELRVSKNQVLKTFGADYSITGIGDDGGGYITLLTGASTPGDLWTLWQDMPIERLTGFSAGAATILGAALNAEFAARLRVEQQLRREIRNCLHVPTDDPIGGQDLSLDLRSVRAGKFFFWDVDGNPAVSSGTGGGDASLRSDLANGLVGPGHTLVAQKRTAAEILAGVIPTSYSIAPYIRGRYNNFTDWRLACDQAGAEGQLDADYAIVADTYLPKKCDFKGYKITGLFKTIHAYHNGGWVHGWRAFRQCIFGCFYSHYSGIESLASTTADKLLVMGGDGVGVNVGCFWNYIGIHAVQCTELNADRFDVNFNTFHGGISRFVHLTGGGVGVGQIHANTFANVDMSDFGDFSLSPNCGYLQDDPVRSKNFLLGLYYENGSQITGNVDIKNFQADTGVGMPLADRFNHIMGAVGLNARAGRDFLSLSVHNLAVGGNWDILDSTGKPPSFANNGGAAVAVSVDNTEPSGAGSRYQAGFADAFDFFQITLQPSGVDRFGAVIFYKSTADFAAIESNDGSSSTSYGTVPVVVDAVNNWKMLRIAGAASKTGTSTITLYGYAGVGGALKTMSIGGVFAGSEKAVITPQRPPTRTRFGSAVFDPASLADGAGATTTVAVVGAALGDFAQASFSLALQGITLTAWVSAADTVSVRFQNESGGVLDLASGTLRVQVQTPYA